MSFYTKFHVPFLFFMVTSSLRRDNSVDLRTACRKSHFRFPEVMKYEIVQKRGSFLGGGGGEMTRFTLFSVTLLGKLKSKISDSLT